MAGMLIGSFIFGLISDKFGRRNAHMVATMNYVLGGCISATLSAKPDVYPMFVFCRFWSATGHIGLMITAFTLAIEYMGTSKRLNCGMFNGVPYAMGGLIVGIVAWAGVRDWRMLQYACTIPWIGLFTYHWLVPESPRWLLANGSQPEWNP